MKRRIKLEEAIGKTIAKYEISYAAGQIILNFSDGTFVTLGAENEEVDEAELKVFDFGDEMLIHLGIFNSAELAELRTFETNRLIAEDEKYERALLNKLAEKYKIPNS